MVAYTYHRSSSTSSLPTSANDVVSVARERFNDVKREHLSPLSDRVNLLGLRDGFDAIVKVMFSPCINGAAGGNVPEGVSHNDNDDIPAAEFGGRTTSAPVRRGISTTPSGGATPQVFSSIPFEVSASNGASLVGTDIVSGRGSKSSAGKAPSSTSSQQRSLFQRQETTPMDNSQSNQLSSESEKRIVESQARLRQLGAKYILASSTGQPMTCTPALPADTASRNETALYPEEVDFDDGISAISSHTLEAMERRRVAKEMAKGSSNKSGNSIKAGLTDSFHGAAPHGSTSAPSGGWCRQSDDGPLAQVDEGAEVIFGEPFYQEDDVVMMAQNTMNKDQQQREIISPKSVADKIIADLILKKTEMNQRVGSNQTKSTMNTTATDDDSGEFQAMLQRNEAIYWGDEEHVKDVERKSRGLKPMSIEERALRLREVSRSRSRSDGTGNVSVFKRRRLSLPCYFNKEHFQFNGAHFLFHRSYSHCPPRDYIPMIRFLCTRRIYFARSLVATMEVVTRIWRNTDCKISWAYKHM